MAVGESRAPASSHGCEERSIAAKLYEQATKPPSPRPLSPALWAKKVGALLFLKYGTLNTELKISYTALGLFTRGRVVDHHFIATTVQL